MTLPYCTVGPDDAPPLIFLHGLGASAQQTTSAFADLQSRHVIAPDMPGHGDAAEFSPIDALCFEAFADHVVDLMDALGIPSVDLGGLSMGAGIALNLALRYPDRVGRLVLLRPSWLDTKRPQHLELVAKVGLWIEDGGPQYAAERLEDDDAYAAMKDDNPPAAASVAGLLSRQAAPLSVAVLYRMYEDRPFASLDELAGVSQPALVMSTTRDDLHPASVADKIAQALPDATRLVLPPRYHAPSDYQSELVRAVQAFLDPPPSP